MHEVVNHALTLLAAIDSPAERPVHADRPHVVAHATLAAALQHWPELRHHEWQALLERTGWIREQESARWLKQRRLALARLARADWDQTA